MQSVGGQDCTFGQTAMITCYAHVDLEASCVIVCKKRKHFMNLSATGT